MKLKKKLIACIVITGVVLCTNIAFAKDQTNDKGLKGFISQIKKDKQLKSIKNDDELLKSITGKAEKQSLSEEETDEAVKQYLGEQGVGDKSCEVKKTTPAVDSELKKELNKQRKKHDDKMKKVEEEIKKVGKYDCKAKYEKNIKFLLENKTNLSKDEVTYYVSGYSQHVKNTAVKSKMQKFLRERAVVTNNSKSQNVLNTNISGLINSYCRKKYNRYSARKYALKYCGINLGVYDSTGYNNKYPAYSTVANPDNDCVNFASQCLVAGGKTMTGTEYGDIDAWFCNTNDPVKLELVALSWRYCPTFKEYWKIRCKKYCEVKGADAASRDDFTKNVWKPMLYGDIIQLADEGGAPWHNIVVTSYYDETKQKDIGYTAHSLNRKNQSLYNYISQNQDTMLLLYHM
jgi:hypothetical protein